MVMGNAEEQQQHLEQPTETAAVEIVAPPPHTTITTTTTNKEEEEDNENDDDEEKAKTTTASTIQRSSSSNNKITAAPPPLGPVSRNDEFDDSEAEHAYLREKRMRKPARLWRSARERAVWLKTVLLARRAAQQSSAAASAQAVYCTHMLYDRGSKMLKVAAKLAEDTLKWEQAEAKRVEAEGSKPGRLSTGGGGGDDSIAPERRPLMIRTARCKTDDGMKVILKVMGKHPFPPNQKTGGDVVASEEVTAACRWGYQCSVCMLAGDLLCCEHAAGCPVSVHASCNGLPFPQGPWICGNLDEGRVPGRVRRQRLSGGVESEVVAALLGAADSSEDDGGSGGSQSDRSAKSGDDDSGGGGGRRGGRKRGKSGGSGGADSDVSISGSDDDDDDDDDDDEGRSGGQQRKSSRRRS